MKFEIRNSKSEENPKFDNRILGQPYAHIGYSELGFVSSFELRTSNFGYCFTTEFVFS